VQVDLQDVAFSPVHIVSGHSLDGLLPEKNVCMLVLTHRPWGFVSGLSNVKPGCEKKFENRNLFPLAAGPSSHYN
jgi:hypothetical protein